MRFLLIVLLFWGALAKEPKSNLKVLEANCTKKDALSCKKLGDYFIFKNFQKALFFYKKACKLKEPEGCFNFGSLLLEQNKTKEAIKIYKNLCQRQKYPQACFRLGRIFYTFKDFNKTREYFLKACEKGVAQGCLNAGTILIKNSRNIKKDGKKAFELYKKSADLGLPEAYLNLAWLYQNGIGVKKDLKKAFLLYKKGIVDKYAILLGEFYIKYKGFDKEFEKIIKSYQNACKKKEPKSCYILGELYRAKWKKSKKKIYLKRSLDLFETSCRKKFFRSCSRLGYFYTLGKKEGVKQNLKRAKKLFEKACQNGDFDGCKSLGLFYYYGIGVKKNKEKAEQFFKKACKENKDFFCKESLIRSQKQIEKSKLKH
jgi:TPR repeat protein